MNIKLHLDQAESDPLERTAAAYRCAVEDIVYTAVNEYMLRLGNFKEQCGPECRKTFTDFEAMRTLVHNTRKARAANLPLWADSAGSVHNYEGLGPDMAHKSKRSAF